MTLDDPAPDETALRELLALAAAGDAEAVVDTVFDLTHPDCVAVLLRAIAQLSGWQAAVAVVLRSTP